MRIEQRTRLSSPVMPTSLLALIFYVFLLLASGVFFLLAANRADVQHIALVAEFGGLPLRDFFLVVNAAWAVLFAVELPIGLAAPRGSGRARRLAALGGFLVSIYIAYGVDSVMDTLEQVAITPATLDG